MTPAEIRAWLDQHGHRMDNAVQYLGTEPNAVLKPWEDQQLRYLLAASWPYFHSAGNQSLPAVAQSINDHPGCYADRFYLPETPRDWRMLVRDSVPVFGVESKHQARDFDVVATSISYMVLFVNFCKYLGQSGIPLRWAEREARGLENYPMVLVGGQAFCAPGAMETVVDCVWLGEVEDEPGNYGGIGDVSEYIIQLKREGLWAGDRLECYRRLAREFNHLYFPRFVDVTYRSADKGMEQPSKQVAGYRSTLPGLRMPFRARHVVDMDAIEPLRSMPLLFTSPAMGAGDMETARGCPAWCGFCRLSWVTKPYRQRGVAQSIAHAQLWKRNMGSIEMSPFAPDFPMHTRKKDLLARLLAEVGDEIDSTAIRIDDFIADPEYVALQAAGNAFTVTLGLEAVSQRMRDFVGKGVSDAEACQALYDGIRAGFRKFKFFMIFAYPGEDDADIAAIVRLARRLAEIRDELNQPTVVIQFSWTPLLIEAQTPFQWFAPTPPDHRLIEVIDALRDLKIETKIGTKAEPHKVALFQACQRASRDSGAAIVDVIEAMPEPGWGGVPKGDDGTKPRLEAALRAHGFANGLEDLFDERGEHDLFGWEFIDTGASQELMWRTHRQMVEFLQGTDGATYDQQVADPRYRGNEFVARCDTACEGRTCGACSGADFRKRKEYLGLAAGEPNIDTGQLRLLDETTVAAKVVVRLRRMERYRQVGNDHWRFSIRRAAYQAQEGLGFRIAKRSIRFASDGIKVRDGAAGADYVEFGLTDMPEHGQVQDFMERFTEVISPWLEVVEYGYGPRQASMTQDGVALYELELDEEQGIAIERLRAFAEADLVPLRLATSTSYFGTGSAEVNAKDLVKDVWLLRSGHKLYLRMLAQGPAGIYQLGACVLGKVSWLDLAQHPARRLEWFPELRAEQDLMFAQLCGNCGLPLPVNLLEAPWPGTLCPRCDDGTRLYVAGLYPRAELPV